MAKFKEIVSGMKRRDVLKGISAVAGTAIYSGTAWPLFQSGDDKPAAPALATPIRALSSKGGKLVQPIRIAVKHDGPEAAVSVKLDGKVVDHRNIAAGAITFVVYSEPV